MRAVRAVARGWANPEVRFLVRYPVFTAGLFLLPALLPRTEMWLVGSTIRTLLLARFILPASVQAIGSTFVVGPTRVEIVPDCTPMFPMLLLFGGILAFPASWRAKLMGLAAGAFVLWLYNVIRIFALMAVLHFFPAQFDLVHVYLWQSLTLLVVVGGFLLWIRLLSNPRLRS